MSGRLRTSCAARLLPLLLLLALPAAVQAQYTYTTYNGKITITGYTGSGGAVTIPSTINGLPVTSIGTEAFFYCTSLTSVTIPNSVTSIGDDAFEYSTSLTSVTIGNSVTSIGDYAFSDCTSLISVTIPNSVTNIGHGAFGFCDSLTAITVGALNSFYSSVAGVLFNQSQTTLIQCPGGKAGSYTVTNSVTSIGDYAFSDCTSLISVTIPNSVTNIGSDAFLLCTSLTNAIIGNSVTCLGDYAFSSCTSLTGVTIPNSVISIGDYAFSSTGLTGVTIPNSVTSIGDDAFSYCYSLAGVYFKGNAPSFGSDVFYGTINATVYYLPETTGWGPTFGGRPAVMWNPQVQASDDTFDVRTNQFRFTINGTPNIPIVVEACTDLANPIWSPAATNTLAGGSLYFSDPNWTNYPARLYRIRSP